MNFVCNFILFQRSNFAQTLHLPAHTRSNPSLHTSKFLDYWRTLKSQPRYLVSFVRLQSALCLASNHCPESCLHVQTPNCSTAHTNYSQDENLSRLQPLNCFPCAAAIQHFSTTSVSGAGICISEEWQSSATDSS